MFGPRSCHKVRNYSDALNSADFLLGEEVRGPGYDGEFGVRARLVDATGKPGEPIMRAFTQEKYGPPETLRMGEVERPAPDADEVLVKVLAVSVNPADWHSMRGKPLFSRATLGLLRPKHEILGVDIDKSRSRSLGGSGLGLSIVQQVAQAHSGLVKLSSEVGRGSTFVIWIPALGNDGDAETSEVPDLDTSETPDLDTSEA